MGQNHHIALLSFTFHQKNPLFDVDLFSRTFDMESPKSARSFQESTPIKNTKKKSVYPIPAKFYTGAACSACDILHVYQPIVLALALLGRAVNTRSVV